MMINLPDSEADLFRCSLCGAVGDYDFGSYVTTDDCAYYRYACPQCCKEEGVTILHSLPCSFCDRVLRIPEITHEAFEAAGWSESGGDPICDECQDDNCGQEACLTYELTRHHPLHPGTLVLADPSDFAYLPWEYLEEFPNCLAVQFVTDHAERFRRADVLAFVEEMKAATGKDFTDAVAPPTMMPDLFPD